MKLDLNKLIIAAEEHTIKSALEYINKLAITRVVLFAADSNGKICGAVNEGDIRRALLAGKGFENKISDCLNVNCKVLINGNDNNIEFVKAKELGVRFLPLINENKEIIKIIDTTEYLGFLPIEVVLMAGGRGERLNPLTEKVPKPLLKIGDKSIIDYNIDRLLKFGVKKFHVTLKYLGEAIQSHIEEKYGSSAEFNYIYEKDPRGTAGSLSELNGKVNSNILFMNCDLLTNINFSQLYQKFIELKSDLMVASIPYHVDVPYAVFEFNNNSEINNLTEKPRYVYETNAGIYLFKNQFLNLIPVEGKFDATDFLSVLIEKKKKVASFPLMGYWLDIGRHEDFEKAQRDILYLKFDE